jgi:hypothetical protein
VQLPPGEQGSEQEECSADGLQEAGAGVVLQLDALVGDPEAVQRGDPARRLYLVRDEQSRKHEHAGGQQRDGDGRKQELQPEGGDPTPEITGFGHVVPSGDLSTT